VTVGVRVRRSVEARGMPDAPAVATMVRFGFPLTIASLGLWMAQLADRLVIGAKMGAASVGRYGITYNLALLIALPAAAINLPAYPRLMRAVVRNGTAEAEAEVRTFHRYLTLAVVPIGGWLIVIIPAAARFLGGAGFHIPFVVPMLIVIGLSLDQWNALAQYTLTAHDRTLLQQNLWLADGVLNIVLCLVLVPRFGLVGAAVATLVCFVLVEAAFFVAANRHVDLVRAYQYVTTAKVLAATAVAAAVAEVVVISLGKTGVGIVVATLAYFAVVALGAWLVGELSAREVEHVRRALLPGVAR
jgi:O-antigen/teichoic acid export membrane protein